MLTNTVQKNYIDQGSETNISSSVVCYRSCLLAYMTNPVTLWKGKQQIFVSSMLIKVKNPVCNKSTHLSNKPLEAPESHENSPKPRVESNFRSLHSYLDQNNETLKKKYCSFSILPLQEPLDIILYLHYY